MVDRIGQGGGGGLARAAIEAALKRQAEAVGRAHDAAAGLQGAPGDPARAAPDAQASDFSTALARGVTELNSTLQRAEQLPVDMLSGKVTDLHEATARLKESELSLNFALEVRDKFIDAYREIMRMSV